MRSTPYCLFPRNPFLFSSLNVQKNMLKDKIRLSRFKDAIFKTVRKGDVVIDLGTGTGILAIWAAQAGAKKVYAIEESDAAEAAISVVRDNGYSEIVEVLKTNSQQVVLPDRADILIAELVGHFLFEEGIVEFISDMRGAWLKPTAKIIPSKADVYLAPVYLGRSFEEISFWNEWKEIDLSSISDLAANSAYVELVMPNNLLASPDIVFKVNLFNAQPGIYETQGVFEIHQNGIIDALAGWFDLELEAGVYINTGPESPPTHWKQCVFPLRNALSVAVGDQISYQLKIESFKPGAKWRWVVNHFGKKEPREVHEIIITHRGQHILLQERF